MIPGINGFPMSHRPLVQTREASRAVQAIHGLVEPFRFSWIHSPPRADIRVTGVQLEKLKLFGVYHGAPVQVSSGPLLSHYIVVPLQGDVHGIILGRELHAMPGEALLYPAGSCLNARWSEHCVALVLAIARGDFLAAARRQVPALDGSPALLPKLALNSGPGRSFANVLGCLCAENDSVRDGDGSPGIRAGLQDLLLASLANMNAHLWPRGFERASSRRRRTGVARAVEYIETHAHRAVAPAELARVACLSLRSLQIGFAECFDVGPMTYSRRLRLKRARDELARSDPRDVQLANLAERWGFSSPGAFTRQYRQSFGELPSQTLKAARQTLRRKAAEPLELTG
jgi:AraC-like DNA-binding protein